MQKHSLTGLFTNGVRLRLAGGTTDGTLVVPAVSTRHCTNAAERNCHETIRLAHDCGRKQSAHGERITAARVQSHFWFCSDASADEYRARRRTARTRFACVARTRRSEANRTIRFIGRDAESVGCVACCGTRQANWLEAVRYQVRKAAPTAMQSCIVQMRKNRVRTGIWQRHGIGRQIGAVNDVGDSWQRQLMRMHRLA